MKQHAEAIQEPQAQGKPTGSRQEELLPSSSSSLAVCWWSLTGSQLARPKLLSRVPAPASLGRARRLNLKLRDNHSVNFLETTHSHTPAPPPGLRNQTLGMPLNNLCVNKPSRCFRCTVKFENLQTRTLGIQILHLLIFSLASDWFFKSEKVLLLRT